MINIEDINKCCQILPILRTQPVKMPIGNSLTAVRPIYNEEIRDFIALFNELNLGVIKYSRYIDTMKRKGRFDRAKIPVLSRNETLSWITYLIREDRNKAGIMKSAIEDGIVELLCIHLHELTETYAV